MHLVSFLKTWLPVFIANGLQIPMGAVIDSPLNAEFGVLAKHTLRKWRVPGLSIAVIHESKTFAEVRLSPDRMNDRN